MKHFLSKALAILLLPILYSDHAAFAFSFPSRSQRIKTTEMKVTKNVVVIGNGMVGQRFMENMVETCRDSDDLQLITFCEESRAAYNRVRLTSYFENRDPNSLSMTSDYNQDGRTQWYVDNNVKILINDRAIAIDTKNKKVTGTSGEVIPYDKLVLATGSVPFVPPIPGTKRPGVFVYRTIDDLEAMLEYVKVNNVKASAVIGGGLLGLEAAKAVANMGVKSHIIEFADILMCRQIDQGGHNALVGTIEDIGIKVHCGARTNAFLGSDGTFGDESDAPVAGVNFSNDDWNDLPVQMVVVSCGIKPRDDIARDAGIMVGERGGIIVDDTMKTSDNDIYAIGECALHNNFIYGLVAPGYEMAKVAVEHLSSEIMGHQSASATFTGADLSTKLKLLGCDVASFGVNQPKSDDTDVSELIWNDPVNRIYRKLIMNKAGNKLRGGILVGDASDYSKLHKLASEASIVESHMAASLLIPPSAMVENDNINGLEGDDSNDQICSCNDVAKREIVKAIADLGVENVTFQAIKKCTNAGTGCGGCEGRVKSILSQEMEKAGSLLSNHLCEHFAMSRQELMLLLRTKDPELTSYEEILSKYGKGDGCEICKPTIASILASLHNEIILENGRDSLQDTNDRSLANMQRGGTYSIVPRVPGGELSPNQLITLGEVAKKFNLYSKITGAQRVDLFGASKHQLPDIWEELGRAGFESGHAYGKALRTVKSCVGSTWCRYGVQDSVSFAIRVENRYKGIRSPHKMKSAVSGCARECAEAQSKDFGLIATENGYNLYVGGNGGTNPVHAELLAVDIDEETVIKYLDRYIMYYILTADRLERTAVWQKKLPSGKTGGGPIEHLKEVIIEDSLGVCAELDKRMQYLIDTYHDEWAEIVKDPERRKRFKQFVNTEKTQEKDELIEFIDIRGQLRPADWSADGNPQTNWKPPSENVFARSAKKWVKVGNVDQFAPNTGSNILYGETQIAVFNNAKRQEWYATQNMCPHKRAFVLSQGILGDVNGEPKIACPLHKKTFSLKSGHELGATSSSCSLNIITFPVMIKNDSVFLELPSEDEVNAILGTSGLRVVQTSCKTTANDSGTNAFSNTKVATLHT